jgi:hypothetical protein
MLLPSQALLLLLLAHTQHLHTFSVYLLTSMPFQPAASA